MYMYYINKHSQGIIQDFFIMVGKELILRSALLLRGCEV